MTRSDWISAIAAAGALLALIPAYGAYFRRSGDAIGRGANAKDRGNLLFRAVVLTATAFFILVWELVSFDSYAQASHITIDLHTMPLIWKVAFYALFLVPGVVLLVAVAEFLRAIRS
jgi:hypothetical protein